MNLYKRVKYFKGNRLLHIIGLVLRQQGWKTKKSGTKGFFDFLGRIDPLQQESGVCRGHTLVELTKSKMAAGGHLEKYEF